MNVTACRFGRFALDPAQRRLLAEGQPVTLGARAFDLLVVLVARAGKLVSKHELLELVWPGLVVEENNLQVQVSTLRKLLGSSALATIPGRGYRFELQVETQAAPAAQAADHAVAPAIAVSKANPAAGAPRVATNVPVRQPVLFGRAPDLEAIKALLAREAVVTVAGAGGMGKTRVAQAVAAAIVNDGAASFAEGVWWVDLAPISNGALVASAVARVLQTTVASDRSHLDILAAVLAPMSVLLVLDNCEHVADAVAELIDRACASAPGVRVLVTSQETLKVAGEHVYRLGALPVPHMGATGDAMGAGAVELFAARARAVDPRFVLGPANVDGVAEICRRLDGIPLAIELAAARVPLLGVEGLRARLDERFSVLTAGARVVLRRHQTLRATLEWSHGLLTDEEQRVFRRLGVFAGSFALEAAQHVAQDAHIDGWAALDHLGALVDKSLVLAEGDPVPRYRLLETTRAYALERLAEAVETDATVRRHAEALLERLVAIEDATLRGTLSPALALAEAGPEVDNLRAALAWAAAGATCPDLAIGLAAHSLRVWSATHQLHEGLQRSLELAHLIRDDMPPSLVARFWLAVAGLGMYTTRREAYEAGLRAVTLYRTLDDPLRQYDALVKTSVVGYRFATAEAIGQAIAEAEALVRPEWPALQRARLEFARSRWLVRLGRFDEALAAAQRQAAICLENGSELGRLYAMSNVVAAENQLGRHEAALAHARESIARLEAIGGASGAGHLWLGAMSAELLLGRTAPALASGRIAYALLLREGDQLRTLWGLALCTARRGAPTDAARIVGYVEDALRRAGVPPDPLSRVYEPLWSSLHAALQDEDLARLRAEGAAMREEDVVALALGEGA